MPEEIGGLELGGGGEASEASQQDVDRVRENQGKAKKIGAQIKSMQHQNSQYAALLSILLQWVSDDVLLGYIFHQLVEYKIDPVVIFAQFLPMIEPHVDVAGLQALYEKIWEEMHGYEKTLESVAHRFLLLRNTYEPLALIDKKVYCDFVLRRLEVEQVVDVSSLEQDKITELKQVLLNSI